MVDPAAAGVAVLVCSRNGRRHIAEVLKGLAISSVVAPCEVILVDNGSTDGTSDEAARTWAALASPCPLSIVSEPRAGKSFAFFAGVNLAKHEIVVMCDDDNVLAPDYLSTALELMADPTIGAIGGTGALRSDEPPPPHFFNYAPWFAVGAQIRRPGDAEADVLDLSALYPDMALWGAGMVMRRSDLLSLAAIRGFPLVSGEFKCEDSELCHAIALLGRRLIYSPRLRFEHLIDLDRMQPSRIQRRWEYDALAAPILHCYMQIRRIEGESAWKTASRLLWRIIRAALISEPVRPLVYGSLVKFELGMLMKPTERAVYTIYRQLKGLA